MTNVKIGILFGLSIGTLLLGSLEGSFWDKQRIQLELDAGYRWDRIDEAYEVTDKQFIQPYSSAEHQYKNIGAYVLGGQVVWDVSNWMLKGKGHYGWLFDGSFNHDSFEVAHAKKGHTTDVSGAFGYAFAFCDCFAFVPYVGYGYDHLNLSLRHFRIKSPAEFSNNVARGRFCSSFYGPWLGFDMLYETSFIMCDMCHRLTMNSGYEFHYGRSHTKFHERLFDPDSVFAYRCKMDNMMGNVFHFDTYYHFPCNWIVGLKFQYTYWTNAHKHRDKFTKDSDTGLAATQDQRTFKLRWQSFSALLSFGKIF